MTFRVNIDRLLDELRQTLARLPQNELLHRGQITVEIDGSDERLKGVGEGGIALAATARLFAASYSQIASELECRRMNGQGFARNQP